MRLDDELRKLLEHRQERSDGTRHPILMCHLVLGYPSLDMSIAIAKTILDSGAGLLELQFPFSDPLADGPLIMEANDVALRGGITPLDCFEAVRTIRSFTDTPLIGMSYFNTPYCFPKGGLEGFVDYSVEAGLDGFIVADLPVDEEEKGYWELFHTKGVCPIPIAAPTSTASRIDRIARTTSSGFVYCASSLGTTGVRDELPDLTSYLSRVRESLRRPIAVGFGISRPEHVARLSSLAEIAVVGSASIRIIRQFQGVALTDALGAFISDMSAPK